MHLSSRSTLRHRKPPHPTSDSSSSSAAPPLICSYNRCLFPERVNIRLIGNDNSNEIVLGHIDLMLHSTPNLKDVLPNKTSLVSLAAYAICSLDAPTYIIKLLIGLSHPVEDRWLPLKLTDIVDIQWNGERLVEALEFCKEFGQEWGVEMATSEIRSGALRDPQLNIQVYQRIRNSPIFARAEKEQWGRRAADVSAWCWYNAIMKESEAPEERRALAKFWVKCARVRRQYHNYLDNLLSIHHPSQTLLLAHFDKMRVAAELMS
ncbi:hypothetical protein Moror_10662 [Moniliophthora roreri MCA 2997]|uniref:Uncharacterized protein n=1 Tax=Moniliophthora roreri (strain MCA 2997) TaxID=1381753 RepID=V2WXX1_MONRO|nr:hypothetical protein Moror_10662 [Moniliophthora roreri MCA 2997]